MLPVSLFDCLLFGGLYWFLFDNSPPLLGDFHTHIVRVQTKSYLVYGVAILLVVAFSGFRLL